MEHFMSQKVTLLYPHQACRTRDDGGSSQEASLLFEGWWQQCCSWDAKRQSRTGCLAPFMLSIVNCMAKHVWIPELSNGLWIASPLQQYNLSHINFLLSMFVSPTIATKPDSGGCLDPFRWMMHAIYSHTLLHYANSSDKSSFPPLPYLNVLLWTKDPVPLQGLVLDCSHH